MSEYQICQQCVMDTSDPDIKFNQSGICHYCLTFETIRHTQWFPNEVGQTKLTQLIQHIKKENQRQPYDAIIGLSGGVDSSYLAYWAKRVANLRLLAVHVDAGWNSELAVKNIENIVKKLDIDLHTHVVDWEEMRDVQLAFFKAGVANQDTPQDHAFFAALYRFAVKNNIRYVLNGSNLATEFILPKAWGYNPMDVTQLKGIHQKFGQKKLKNFPLVSFFEYYFYYPYIQRMQVIRPLNFMDYRKEKAMEILSNELDWRYYGGKHYESRFTKFFQAYWLPTKFGYDKRRAHLSSLIVSKQLAREDALIELTKPLYSEQELQEDKELVCKKLGVSVEQFEALVAEPNQDFTAYPNHQWKINCFKKLSKWMQVK